MARLIVKQRLRLVEAMLDVFCGNSSMSLEGDLSQADLRGIDGVSFQPTDVLVRNTSSKADFLVMPINSETKELIKRHVLLRVGISTRVNHILIERNGDLVFYAYDNFDEDCVWVTPAIGSDKLQALVDEGILRRYETTGDQ